MLSMYTNCLCEIYLALQIKMLFNMVSFGIIIKLLKNPALAGLGTWLYDLRLSFKLSSSSCLSSIGAGASIMTSRPELFLGKAIKSRIIS